MDETLREKAQTIAGLMAQMANENRLLILCALLDGPKTVGQLGEEVPNITAPALSQHLHKLKDGGLIQGEKHGQFITYSIKDSRIQALMAVLKEQYCAQSADSAAQTKWAALSVFLILGFQMGNILLKCHNSY